MMKIMLFFKQTWFMSCILLIFSFARCKISKTRWKREKYGRQADKSQRKRFREKFPWNRSASKKATSKGKEYQITLFLPHDGGAEKCRRKYITHPKVCSVCDDKLNLFNFLWFHSRVVVWVRETCVNIIFACLRGRGWNFATACLPACFKTFSASHPQPRRAKISQ